MLLKIITRKFYTIQINNCNIENTRKEGYCLIPAISLHKRSVCQKGQKRNSKRRLWPNIKNTTNGKLTPLRPNLFNSKMARCFVCKAETQLRDIILDTKNEFNTHSLPISSGTLLQQHAMKESIPNNVNYPQTISANCCRTVKYLRGAQKLTFSWTYFQIEMFKRAQQWYIILRYSVMGW